MRDKKSKVEKKRGTFLVNIQYCENYSWQGYVIWAEQNKKEYFHSALELLEMIQDALSESVKGPMEMRVRREDQSVKEIV